MTFLLVSMAGLYCVLRGFKVQSRSAGHAVAWRKAAFDDRIDDFWLVSLENLSLEGQTVSGVLLGSNLRIV